jgi:hypothetical protein
VPATLWRWLKLVNASFNDHASSYIFAKTNPSFGIGEQDTWAQKHWKHLYGQFREYGLKELKRLIARHVPEERRHSIFFGKIGNIRQEDRSGESCGTFSCSKDLSMASITLL